MPGSKLRVCTQEHIQVQQISSKLGTHHAWKQGLKSQATLITGATNKGKAGTEQVYQIQHCRQLADIAVEMLIPKFRAEDDQAAEKSLVPKCQVGQGCENACCKMLADCNHMLGAVSVTVLRVSYALSWQPCSSSGALTQTLKTNLDTWLSNGRNTAAAMGWSSATSTPNRLCRNSWAKLSAEPFKFTSTDKICPCCCMPAKRVI